MDDLAHAKKVFDSYIHQPIFFLSQIEDPAFIYVIGSWDSTEQYCNDFIPWSMNQELPKLFKERVTVEYLFHIDIPLASLPLRAPAISIARHFVKLGRNEAYDRIFNSTKRSLEGNEELGMISRTVGT